MVGSSLSGAGGSTRLSRSLVSAGATACSSSPMKTSGVGGSEVRGATPAASEGPRREFLFPRSGALPAVDAEGADGEQVLGAARSSCSRSLPSSQVAPRSVLSAVTTTFGASPAPVAAELWRSLQGRGLARSSTSPTLGGAKASGASEVAESSVPPLTRPVLPRCDPAKACDVNIPTSVVSSVCSVWAEEYIKQGGPGVAFARGLSWKDIHMSSNQGPGVCYIREAKIPDVPKENPAINLKDINIKYIEGLLRDMGVDPNAPSSSAPARRRGPAPRRSNSESSMVTVLPDRITEKPAVVARHRYQTLVLRPPRSPEVGQSHSAGPMNSASLLASSFVDNGPRRRRKGKMNMAPPTGTMVALH